MVGCVLLTSTKKCKLIVSGTISKLVCSRYMKVKQYLFEVSKELTSDKYIQLD